MNIIDLLDLRGGSVRPPCREGQASSDDNPLAWRREMERAQASAWLSHPLIERDGSRDDAATTTRADAREPGGTFGRSSLPPTPHAPAAPRAVTAGFVSATARPARGSAVGTPAGGTTDPSGAARSATSAPASANRSCAPACPGAQAAFPDAASWAWTQPIARRASNEPGAESAERAGPREHARQPTVAERDPAPVRVHVQAQGRRADVWLGVDGPLLGRLPELAQAVAQSLRLRGLSSGVFVCNGRVLPQRPSPGAARAAITEPSIQPPHGEKQ